MSTPNRYEIIGNSKVVAKVRVLDRNTNEEFDGELRFTGKGGIETIDRENVNANYKVVEDEESKTMWELAVFDQPKDTVADEQIFIDENELVQFIYNKAIEQAVHTDKEQIQKVLDLEMEFLKLKGVIE